MELPAWYGCKPGDLESAFAHPQQDFRYGLFDFRDGLPGPALQDSREPTAAEDSTAACGSLPITELRGSINPADTQSRCTARCDPIGSRQRRGLPVRTSPRAAQRHLRPADRLHRAQLVDSRARSLSVQVGRLGHGVDRSGRAPTGFLHAPGPRRLSFSGAGGQQRRGLEYCRREPAIHHSAHLRAEQAVPGSLPARSSPGPVAVVFHATAPDIDPPERSLGRRGSQNGNASRANCTTHCYRAFRGSSCDSSPLPTACRTAARGGR